MTYLIVVLIAYAVVSLVTLYVVLGDEEFIEQGDMTMCVEAAVFWPITLPYLLSKKRGDQDDLFR